MLQKLLSMKIDIALKLEQLMLRQKKKKGEGIDFLTEFMNE